MQIEEVPGGLIGLYNEKIYNLCNGNPYFSIDGCVISIIFCLCVHVHTVVNKQTGSEKVNQMKR